MESPVVYSPLIESSKAVLERELDSNKIITAYKRDYNIDVQNYFHGLEKIQIYKCLSTKYRFYYPFNLVGESSLYEALEVQPWYYGLRWEHDVAKQFIKQTDQVLEVGCGAGFFLEKLEKEGIKSTGLDFNEKAVKYGQSKGLNIINQDLLVHAKEFPEYYDVVCSFQVLEHIVKVRSFIEAALASLKVGGELIFAVPNNNPYLFKHDIYHTLNLPPHHMGLWDETSLRNLTYVFNLKLEQIHFEPLSPYDLRHYLQLQAAYFKKKFLPLSWLIIFFNFLIHLIKPTRLRSKIQNVICKPLKGRNLIAIYTKI